MKTLMRSDELHEGDGVIIEAEGRPGRLVSVNYRHGTALVQIEDDGLAIDGGQVHSYRLDELCWP